MSGGGLFFGAVALMWAAVAWRTGRDWARAPRLPRAPEPSDAAASRPLVSILVPARNEADRLLEACVRSLLAQDYPHIEIVAVDDRSEDRTGEILSKLAATDQRVTVLAGVEPPVGWVGKQHALMQAAAVARGAWLLAVDADAVYDPGVLEDALRQAESCDLDALSLLPRVGAGDFWVSITYPVGFWALLFAAPLDRVNRPDTATGLAWGGFFLVRRDVFDAVGGYEAVRDETSEDTKLAALLKRRGFRLRVVLGMDRVFTPMYPTLGQLWQGTMKNVYCGPWLTPLIAAGLAAIGVVPALTALAAANQGLWPAAALAAPSWALLSLALVPVYRAHRIPAWRAIFAPVGTAICVAQMLGTTWLVAVTGRGIAWRGRRVRARRSPARSHSLPGLSRRQSPR